MDEAVEAGGGILAKEVQDHPVADHPKRSGRKSLVRNTVKKLGRLPQFFTIGHQEIKAVKTALKAPLSGYIGGSSLAGYWCTRLADEWSETFKVRYAIPCNSATSGLLAACMAADIGEGDLVLCPTYTMSATATCAMMLGANVKFCDIDKDFFCATGFSSHGIPKAIIVTNLFGCGAKLMWLRGLCDNHGITLIEDNAQAPFATIDGQYTGTIGHMGVFSLNVHKHIQCGEGGVIVTNDPQLAHRLDCAINHGELMKTNPNIGLNLRMTEPIAAIASSQLRRGRSIVQTRISLAEEITNIFRGVPFVEPPQRRENSDHVYYMWAGKIKGPNAKERRNTFLAALQARGVPFRMGYSVPLHRLFGHPEDDDAFPVVREMEDERLFVFEICAFDPKRHHLRDMRDIIHAEADTISNMST